MSNLSQKDDSRKQAIQGWVQQEINKSKKVYKQKSLDRLEGVSITMPLLFLEAMQLLSNASEHLRDGEEVIAKEMRVRAKAIYRSDAMPNNLSQIALNFDAALDAEEFYNRTIKQTNDTLQSWVYFALCPATGFVKIGTSTQVEKRVRNLSHQSGQSLKILKCIKGSYTNESEIHRKFSSKRHHGEWFVYDYELENYINSLTDER